MLNMHVLADQINAAFRRYGLDHNVVEVISQMNGQGWESERLALVGEDDPEVLVNLVHTIEYLCDEHVRTHPEQEGQLRLF